MANNPRIKEIGKKFSKDYQPENPGRKKVLFNWLKNDYHLSQIDVNNIIDHISMMSQADFEKMKKKIKDKHESVKDMPMIMVKFFEAYEKAKIDDLIKILKASGKASEKTEVTTPEGIEIIYTNKTK